jgi:hypothetical protein
MSTSGKRPKRAEGPYPAAIKAGKRLKHDLGVAGHGIDTTIGGAGERINAIMRGKKTRKNAGK